MWSAYSYSDDKPSIEADADGMCPKYHMDKSCTDLVGAYASVAAACAQKHCYEVEDQFTCSGFSACDVTITVKCRKSKLHRNACGEKDGGHTIIVSTHPDCPSLCCLILHEAIHVCMGLRGTGKDWPEVFIPGCGNISYNHNAPPGGYYLP